MNIFTKITDFINYRIEAYPKNLVNTSTIFTGHKSRRVIFTTHVNKIFTDMWVSPETEYYWETKHLFEKLPGSSKINGNYQPIIFLVTNSKSIAKKLQDSYQAEPLSASFDGTNDNWHYLYRISIPLTSNIKVYLQSLTRRKVYYDEEIHVYKTNYPHSDYGVISNNIRKPHE